MRHGPVAFEFSHGMAGMAVTAHVHHACWPSLLPVSHRLAQGTVQIKRVCWEKAADCSAISVCLCTQQHSAHAHAHRRPVPVVLAEMRIETGRS
jgi:hypothetical protein